MNLSEFFSVELLKRQEMEFLMQLVISGLGGEGGGGGER